MNPWPSCGEDGWTDQDGYHLHTFETLPSGDIRRREYLNGLLVRDEIEETSNGTD